MTEQHLQYHDHAIAVTINIEFNSRDHVVLLIVYKLIAAVLIFLISFFSVLYPLRRKHGMDHAEGSHFGEAIASGIFLGAAFFHMLPDSIKLFRNIYPTLHYPVPEAVCVIGFMLMLFLERLSQMKALIKTDHSIPYVLAIILIVHALTEGIALGIGITLTEAIMLFIAIFAHKGSESFALCVMLLRYKLPVSRVLPIVVFFAFMTPIGIGLGALVNAWSVGGNGQLTASLFNSFAAGTFLYISTLHHIQHKHDTEQHGMRDFLYLLIGMASMGIIAIWA